MLFSITALLSKIVFLNFKMDCLPRKWYYLKEYVVILHSQGIPISDTSKLDCHCLIRTILNLASDVAITWGKRQKHMTWLSRKKEASSIKCYSCRDSAAFASRFSCKIIILSPHTSVFQSPVYWEYINCLQFRSFVGGRLSLSKFCWSREIRD